jgi:hypothetical protein
MAAYSISLGSADRLTLLFSYPNDPNSSETLADTILHWLSQTLQRDGLTERGASAAVRVEGTSYFLDLDGPPLVAERFPEYFKRLPQLLSNGWDALTNIVPRLQAEGKWDPEKTGQWRFFLPLGLAMLSQRSLQFFHYPPIRLLNAMRDYLKDPVPDRWAELLEANGVASDAEAWLYETVVDATPIAAPDDQGSKKAGDPHWGLIPIQYFTQYQRAQVNLLLNTAPNTDDHTIPIVVYGNHPNDVFSQLYGVRLGVNVATTAKIIPGKTTAVLGANHPYRFYATAQIGNRSNVGSGKILPKNCQDAVSIMAQDLIVARWQKVMADDPSRDPQAVLSECTKYWHDSKRAAQICALVQHQGSLCYPDPKSLNFQFNLSLDQAAAFCKKNKNDPCAGKKNKKK